MAAGGDLEVIDNFTQGNGAAPVDVDASGVHGKENSMAELPQIESNAEEARAVGELAESAQMSEVTRQVLDSTQAPAEHEAGRSGVAEGEDAEGETVLGSNQLTADAPPPDAEMPAEEIPAVDENITKGDDTELAPPQLAANEEGSAENVIAEGVDAVGVSADGQLHDVPVGSAEAPVVDDAGAMTANREERGQNEGDEVEGKAEHDGADVNVVAPEVEENAAHSGMMVVNDSGEGGDALQQAADESYQGNGGDDKSGNRRKRKRLSDPLDSRSNRKIGRYFVNGVTYNARGYEVCGFLNQRGSLCGRIGKCPFHADGSKNGEKRRQTEPAPARPEEPVVVDEQTAENFAGVQVLDEAPSRQRFKQSWSQDEHFRFCDALRKFGKGNWKKIAEAVSTRTANQCQSHAQKYFLRQNTPREQRKKKSIHDAAGGLPEGEGDDSAKHLAQVDANGAVNGLATVGGAAAQNGANVMPIMLPLGGLNQQNPLQSMMNIAGMQPQKMRVTIHRNGESQSGKAMIVPNTLEQFFQEASEKLEGKNYCRAFTRSGGEISSLDELCQDDTLWLTDGADFIFPPA